MVDESNFWKKWICAIVAFLGFFLATLSYEEYKNFKDNLGEALTFQERYSKQEAGEQNVPAFTTAYAKAQLYATTCTEPYLATWRMAIQSYAATASHPPYNKEALDEWIESWFSGETKWVTEHKYFVKKRNQITGDFGGDGHSQVVGETKEKLIQEARYGSFTGAFGYMWCWLTG